MIITTKECIPSLSSVVTLTKNEDFLENKLTEKQ